LARFDRYFLSQLLMLFGFFALVLVGVYWINRAVALFDQIISDGQSAGVFLELTALTLPNVIRIVLPVPAFAAAVYVTNRLITEGELIVMQASGQGPFRLARPVVVFGLFVTLLLSVLAHSLVPISRSLLAERRAEIAENITARFLVEGRFMHPAEGLTVYIREISETGELSDLLLSDQRRPEVRTTYTASRALLVRAEGGPKLVMFSGLAQTYDVASGRLTTMRFSDFTYDLAELVSGGRLLRPDVNELPTPVLLAPDAAVLEATGKPASVLLYEGHARFAQPLLGLVGPLVGFAAVMAAGFSRFGLWRQIALAVVLLVILQLLENAIADRALADSALLPLVYLPPLVGLVMVWSLLSYAGRRRRRRPDTLPAGEPA
jgi:lipopolysaccharide export system permease protein